MKRYFYIFYLSCKILVSCKLSRTCGILTSILDVISFCYAIFLMQEAANLKQKLEKCEFDLENTRKSSELSLIPLASIAAGSADLLDTAMQELYAF